MKREELTEILRKSVVKAGYDFQTGPAHRMNGTLRVYPAVWLEPCEMCSLEGRKEGDVTYKTVIHFMAIPSARDDHRCLWAELESDAIGVVRDIAKDRAVREVSKISCVPSQQAFTVHGELAMTLTCEITMWFYV